jgi:hypothetical protein
MNMNDTITIRKRTLVITLITFIGVVAIAFTAGLNLACSWYEPELPTLEQDNLEGQQEHLEACP